jgi:hypothetical protein
MKTKIKQKIEQAIGTLKDSDCIDCKYETFCEKITIGKTFPCDFVLLFLKLAEVYESEDKKDKEL